MKKIQASRSSSHQPSRRLALKAAFGFVGAVLAYRADSLLSVAGLRVQPEPNFGYGYGGGKGLRVQAEPNFGYGYGYGGGKGRRRRRMSQEELEILGGGSGGADPARGSAGMRRSEDLTDMD